MAQKAKQHVNIVIAAVHHAGPKTDRCLDQAVRRRYVAIVLELVSNRSIVHRLIVALIGRHVTNVTVGFDSSQYLDRQ